MATKAEAFRAEMERSGPGKTKRPKKIPRNSTVNTATTRRLAAEKKTNPAVSLPHNFSKRADTKSGVALEFSQTKPSRKSTRGSKGKVKNTAPIEINARNQALTSKAKALRAKIQVGSKR